MGIEVINQFLSWCCGVTGEFFTGVLLFGVITKLILLPVSLWCHWNQILMVRLLPQLNEAKSIYAADSELLAQTERKLFKEAGYHPFLSLLPVTLQLILLILLLSAVEKQLAGVDSFAAMVPVKDGGISWVMPIFAGVSAALFGWSQNACNPLQREQSRTSQFITNIISISISFFFGLFVMAGISFYWSASNLLSILFQLICNRLLPPAKFINYYRLRKSQIRYNKVRRALHSKMTPEQKKKEREDRKRFFSVANKHIVFYSEASGFYKYFEQIINYLLENSNCIIHYVTSDFHDRIFEMNNPRIKGYFQGPAKLISLFMRMDADIVVMTTPDLGNFHLKRSYVKKDIEYIYTDHAISSTHMTLREHALDNFDTIFCVCDSQVRELRKMEELYHTNRKNLVHCGYGLLDTLMARYANETSAVTPGTKRILIAPSWHEGNILDGVYQEILEQLTKEDYLITVRPHPEYLKRFPHKWAAVTAFCKAEKYQNVVLESDFSSNETIFTSDMVITDWSGIAYEFAFSVLRPVLFINTPMKVINPNYRKVGIEPINITMRDETGISLNISETGKITETVRELFQNPERYREKIIAAREKYVFNAGKSGEVAGRYILERLVEKQQSRRKTLNQ